MLFSQVPDPTKVKHLTAQQEERINGVRKVPVGSDYLLQQIKEENKDEEQIIDSQADELL